MRAINNNLNNRESKDSICRKNLQRLRFLQIAVCVGFVIGIFLSYELWFPILRTFPRAPVFAILPENTVPFAEWFLSCVLLVSLLLFVAVKSKRKTSLILVIISICLLVFLDQMRLQPWVYQYFLILILFAFYYRQPNEKRVSEQTLGLMQLLIAGLYVWSGLQKFNYAFAYETLPLLLEPLQNFIAINELPLGFIGLILALIEVLVGCGLLFKRTRNLSVCIATILHIFILIILITMRHNQIVWIWNVTLIALVLFAFWRSDVSIRKIFVINPRQGWKIYAVKAIILASLLLPVLSLFGLWDMYLSGALYSGKTEVGVIRIDDATFEKLPTPAKTAVFKSKGNKILPLFEWSIRELNVPVYPEQRIFKQITREVCHLPEDNKHINLIIKKRSSTFEGRFELLSIKCRQL